MEKVHPLINIFKAAPCKALPKVNTKSYVLLKLLSDSHLHERNNLIQFPALGESMRSALQDLRGDKRSHWLIHSVRVPNSKATSLQLDIRHLSGDPKQDAAARTERRKQLKEKSHKEAKQGRIREPKAFSEMTEAQAEYFKSLGKAANDEQ